MTPISLSIDLLRIDAGTQSRSAIIQEVVDDYADVIEQSSGEWPFPPLDVFHDSSEYFVSDGFHRLLAALRVKRASVPCVIHKGTAMDARIFGMTANDKHGVRMTRADKRENVIWLLDHGGKLTQTAISEKAGVSIRTVKRIISERNPASLPSTGRPPARDGKGTMSPNTPIRGGSEDPFDEPCPPDDDSDLFECAPEKAALHSKGSGKPKGGSKTVVGKTGRESEVWTAQQVMKTWIDAIGRWMNGNPHGIDVYRDRFPGPKGDQVIDAAKTLLNAVDAWKKVLK